MSKIVVYNPNPHSILGINTFEKNLIRFLVRSGHCVVYLSNLPVDGMPEDITTIVNTGQPIHADVCIHTSIYKTVNQIHATRHIQVIHMDLSDLNKPFEPDANIDTFVSVGPSVTNSLRRLGYDSVEIPNILYPPPTSSIKKVLRLMSASRISKGKGFDRAVKLVEAFSNSGLPFTFEIYGRGSKKGFFVKEFEPFPEVHFMGVKENIYSYMKASDFVVQLSDSEGYCYAVHESLSVGTPVIVTDWSGIRETVIPGKNGIILNMDMSNLNVQEIYDFAVNQTMQQTGFCCQMQNTASEELWNSVLS